MKAIFWIGLILVFVGAAAFFLALVPNTTSGDVVRQGASMISSNADRSFPMTARILVLVGGFGLLTVGAVAVEE